MTSAWRILRWSSELARGELSHPTHGVLAFDANVATVGRFIEGEWVDVELGSDGRVRSVRPRGASSAKVREPEISVTPTGLLDFRFASDNDRSRIEDVVFERLALASVPSDLRTGYLRDVPDACRALLEALSGKALEPFVRVDASYFFVWSGRQFDEVVTRLPGFRGGTSFFGDGTRARAALRKNTAVPRRVVRTARARGLRAASRARLERMARGVVGAHATSSAADVVTQLCQMTWNDAVGGSSNFC